MAPNEQFNISSETNMVRESSISSNYVTDRGSVVADYEEFEESFSESETQDKLNCCNNKMLLMKTICSGQLLSLMLCSTGTAVTALKTFYLVETPCLNAFLMYALLSATFGVYALTRKDIKEVLRKHWWKYLIVSIFDVEGNYLLTKAYSFTTLTSVQLCDSFTIPTVMLISFIFLRIRYKILHYIGVAVCLSGAIVLVFSDGGDVDSNAPNEVLGDVIALCAAVLYGISNVGQEYLVKSYSSSIYLGMIGIYGVIITAIQTALLERNSIRHITWNWQIGLLFAGFAVAQYIYYAVMPVVMKLSSATVVNLSLLTSDLYTLIVGLSIFVYRFSLLYFVAFAGIFTGLILYNVKATPTVRSRRMKKEKQSVKNYVRFNNENGQCQISKNSSINATYNKTPLINSDVKRYTIL